MNAAVAAFWSYAASYAVLNGPTLRLRLNGVCSKPVAASDRLRLRFVLLRISRTRRPTNRGLPPHRCSSPLKQRVEHGGSHPWPSQEVGDSWPMKNSSSALFWGAAHRLCLRACISAAAAAAARIAGRKSPLTPPTRLRQRSVAMAAPFPHELGIGTNKWKLKHIDEVQATFGAALDAGISLFDTAQCYASSEACLGYVRKRDREPFIVTKFDSLRGGPDRLVPTLRKSLFDLDLDCVDAYLVHFPRGDIDELAAALAEAVELGLTKRVGCSNFGRAEMLALRTALERRGVPLSIVEVEFSLLRRRTEALVNECRRLGITVLAWAPLGSGRLVHADRVGDARTLRVSSGTPSTKTVP